MLSKQNPDIAANPGAVQQGQMLRFLSRCANTGKYRELLGLPEKQQ